MRRLKGVNAIKDFVGDTDGDALGLRFRHALKKRGFGATLHSLPMSDNLLKPIPDLEFFDDLHKYRYKGRWLPFSVSRIASPASPEAQYRFEQTRHIWEPRGNAVHAYCEALLTDQELPETEYEDWTQALEDCWLLKDCEVLAAEYRCCDPHKGVGGSFDFLLRSSTGKVCLGDLKTVGTKSAVKRRKPATAQLGGYLAMLQDFHPTLWIDSCYTLVCGPGESRLIENKPDECLGAWVDAWDIFKVEHAPF